MHVIISCKYEKGGMKNSQEKWQHRYFRCSRAGNSVVRGRIWPNFKLIQALMYVIVTCKYDKETIKKQLRISGNTVFPIISLWGFFLTLTPQSVVE